MVEMKNTMRAMSLIAAAILTFELLLVQVVRGQDDDAKNPKVKLDLTCDARDGIARTNQIVKATATLKNLTDEYVYGTVTWQIKSANFKPAPVRPLKIRLSPNESQKIIHSITADEPGLAEFIFNFEPRDGGKNLSDQYRFASQPDRVKTETTKRDDFDEFWKSSLEQLSKVDPSYSVSQCEETSASTVYEVHMQGFGDVQLHGWLEVPKGDGPFPVVVRVPGYNGKMEPVGNQTDLIVFSINPRGHGKSVKDVAAEPVDFWIRGLDRKEDYFYRGAFLDCVRAIDFVCSRPEVDQDRIAIWGASQGGGLAMATAALDRRIDLCIADIPWLCDWVNFFQLTDWPEMNKWIDAEEHRSWEKTLATLSYFDVQNLAERIRCRTVMSVGLQDQICPPVTSFNAFNRIPIIDKSFKIDELAGHGLDEDHQAQTWKQIREQFEMVTSDDQ